MERMMQLAPSDWLYDATLWAMEPYDPDDDDEEPDEPKPRPQVCAVLPRHEVKQ